MRVIPPPHHSPPDRRQGPTTAPTVQPAQRHDHLPSAQPSGDSPRRERKKIAVKYMSDPRTPEVGAADRQLALGSSSPANSTETHTTESY